MPVTEVSITDQQGPAILSVHNASGKAPVILVCEHASNHIPADLRDLGISEDVRQSHVAWDPGALGVALELSDLLDAPLLVGHVSRLVYDCNRPPEDQSAIPAKSEIYDIPGNANLSDGERARRAKLYYDPFRLELAGLVQAAIASHPSPILANIHSFTPVYFGQKRQVEIGILHDADARVADCLLASMHATENYRVERNEPYGPEDGVTHTLRTHALPFGLLNVMIEIRNDLIRTSDEQKGMAAILARHFDVARNHFAQPLMNGAMS